MSKLVSRRELLRGGSMIAVGLVAPKWLSAIAKADVLRQAGGGKAMGDTVLVVCQFLGGNDGLNTVIPYGEKAYYQLRPNLGIPDSKVIPINDQIGFHPSLTGLAELYKQGKVAVLQNVGYPLPNRSHFRSMAIWESGSRDDSLKYGWLGRHFDYELTKHPLNPIVAIGVSTEKPLALQAENASIPCFASLADLHNMVGDRDFEQMLRQIQGPPAGQGTTTSLIQKATESALDAVDVLNKQLAGYKIKETYGNDPFGNGFKQVAQIIATSPQCRVLYFSAGGFDTHAHQGPTHDKLLKQFGDGVNAFQKELESMGKAENVVTITFSEFGRRAHENASIGTDHGAAAPMFVVGSKVKGGLHGPIPDLTDLSDGDIRYKIDFREVYAAMLDEWIGGDSEIVLGQKFAPIDVFQA